MLDTIEYKWYRFKYNYAPYLKLTKPIDVSLELVASCNQRCTYCYFAGDELPFQKGLMSELLAIKTIDDAANCGVESIKFNYRGESTLHPQYFKILSHAKSRGFIDRLTNSNFNFSTDREDIFEALCTLTKVKVSFDSFKKDVITKVRVGTNYERALNNITKFYNHTKRRSTRLVIQAVRTQANKDEDLVYEIKRRWPSAEFSIRDMVEGRVEKDLSHLKNKERDRERQSCIQAHARLIVRQNGTVGPCCPDISEKLVIGDLNYQSIKEVWNSESAKRLRKHLLNKEAFELDPCKSCSSFESYKGYKHPKDS